MITLYDLIAKDPVKTWSPNPWKVRYVLNLKNLPYKTLYLEYPDLEGEFKKVGIPPNGKKPDGNPFYTSPSITDDGTGTAVADSYKIAEYLDKAYPNTPKAFPPGSEAFQAAFYDQFNQLISPVWPMLLPRVPALLNEAGAKYFTDTRSAYFGKPLDQVELKGDARVEAWGKIKAGFDSMNGWLGKSSGPFFLGDTVSFADIIVASFLQALRIVFGENHDDWKDVKTWNGGRWVKLLNDLDKYASEEK